MPPVLENVFLIEPLGDLGLPSLGSRWEREEGQRLERGQLPRPLADPSQQLPFPPLGSWYGLPGHT